MFEKTTEELTKMGAQITTAEIKQQPELWQEAFANYTRDKEKITAFWFRLLGAGTPRKA